MQLPFVLRGLPLPTLITLSLALVNFTDAQRQNPYGNNAIPQVPVGEENQIPHVPGGGGSNPFAADGGNVIPQVPEGEENQIPHVPGGGGSNSFAADGGNAIPQVPEGEENQIPHVPGGGGSNPFAADGGNAIPQVPEGEENQIPHVPGGGGSNPFAADGGNAIPQVPEGEENQIPHVPGGGGSNPFAADGGNAIPQVPEGEENQIPHVPEAGGENTIPHVPEDSGAVSQNLPDYQCDVNDRESYTIGTVTFELRCNYGAYIGDRSSAPTSNLKQCADLCAQDDQCQGADWDHSSRVCHLKGPQYFPGAASNGHHQWRATQQRVPRTCPPVTQRLAQPKPNALVVDNPQCPDDNGNLFSMDDGSYFTLLCCTHNPDNSEIPNTKSTVSSFKECATTCSSTSGCQSYVYSARANSVDARGTCKLYNTGGHQTFQCGDDTHDYAYITAPPAIDSPDVATVACATECPFSDGQQYKSKGGELFHMDCAKRHGTTVLYEDTQETFKDCMDACSKFIPCHSVDYHTNSKTCYYSNHHGEPQLDAWGFQSAHSMGCSGACGDEKSSCGCVSQGSDFQGTSV